MQLHTYDFATYAKNLSILYKMIKFVHQKYNFINFNNKLIKIKYFIEFKTDSNNKIVVFFTSAEVLSNLRKIQAYLLEEIETSMENTIMLFCEMKSIIPYKYQKKTNNKNYFKSYSFVFIITIQVLDHMIKNMVFPALIIGKRIFFYTKKVSVLHVSCCIIDLFRIYKFLNMIAIALKKIFKKDVVIEIVKNPDNQI
uniref:Ribosomal protein S7 n=1 Tax=Lotharella vacuolata TaxID=74820 RepID=A0A0H5BKX8_9EUKA|nr:ribosomal protein S7 [Lotharella vacuolata]